MGILQRTFVKRLQLAKAGSDSAFRGLIEPQRKWMETRASRQLIERIARRVDVDDVCQLAIISAWRGLAEFEGRTRQEWRAWLKVILDREIIQLVRRHVTAECRGIGREVYPRDTDESGGGDSIWIAAETSPSQKAIKNEACVVLKCAIDQMPANERDVVCLSQLEKRPEEEIAGLTGRTRPAVAGLLRRGMKRLRTLLRTDSREEPR